VAAMSYREFVEECLGWAKTAKSDKERKIFEEMAEIWLAAAIRREGKQSTRFERLE
jgi:hypothetical protein